MATVTIDIDTDSYTQSDSPDTNFGTSSALELRDIPSGVKNMFLYADILASVPSGATIDSATLRVWFNSGTSPVKCESVAAAWVETTITHNNQPGITGAILSTVTISVSGSETAHDWDVKQAVQDIVYSALTNNGFRLAHAETGGSSASNARSSDYPTAGVRPDLIITWHTTRAGRGYFLFL